MPDWRIALEISGRRNEDGWTSVDYRARINDQVRFANVALTGEQIDEMEAIGDTYNSLFDDARPPPPNVKAAQLKAIGARLFDLWLGRFWQELRADIPTAGRRLLVVASDQAAVLNLPWELLRLDGAADPLGVDAAWGVCRFPQSNLPTDFQRTDAVGSKQGGAPLRVLFLAASPQGFPELDYEREEELFLGALESSATLEIGDLGTFKELGDRIDSFKPHIVHLSGHATTGDAGAAFAFESEAGDADLRSAQRIAAVFRGAGVRCAFVSGCGTAVAPSRDLLGGVCQSLVANGVPLAIGWAASIIDNVATEVAKSFYSTVVDGRPADFALARARSSVRVEPDSGDPSWSLPILYSSVADMRVYDETAKAQGGDDRSRPSHLNRPLPGMREGFAQQFNGRRRELQAALPGLRDGRYAGVIITGMDGTGKSSFATRLVRRLEGDGGRKGRKPIVSPCKPGEPTQAQELLDRISLAFRSARYNDDAELLRDATLSLKDRLQAAIDCLNDTRFTLVLDGFESNLDHKTREFLNSDIKYFFERLLDSLVGDSRVVITSRFLPEGVSPLPRQFLELSLGELPETAYLKFLLRDDDIKTKYQAGQLTRLTLLHLRRHFGSSPQFVAQMRDKLRKLDTSGLAQELKARAVSRTAASGPALDALVELYGKHCNALGLTIPCSVLGSPSVTMIGRAAVHPGPLTLDAIVKLGEGTSLQAVEKEAGYWRNVAFAHVELGSGDKLWSVYGTLRDWLTAPARFSDGDWRAAHKAAAEFFSAIATGLVGAQRHAELQLNKSDCLLAARDHYLAIPDCTSALKMSVSLNKILRDENRYDELVQLNQELLDYCPHPEPATWVALAYLRRPNYQRAEEWYKRALELAVDPYHQERSQALQGLAAIAWHKNQDEQTARDYLVQAIDIQQANSDTKGEGVSIHQLGSIDFDRKRYTEARSQIERALELLKGPDADEDRQAAMHQLGSIDLEEDHLEEARKELDIALTMARTLQDARAEAAAIHQLGRVTAKEAIKANKKPWPGLAQLRTALKLRQQIGDGSGEAQSFRRIGELLSEAGQEMLALRFFIVSHYLYETLGDAAKRVLADRVEEKAAKLGRSADALGKLEADAQQAYLRDRGKQLLRAASNAMLKDIAIGSP